MTKKIFAISTLFLVLLVGAIFVYNFAFKKSPDSAVEKKSSGEGKTDSQPDGSNAKNQTPPKQTGGTIAAISETAVFGATLAPDGRTIYYFSGMNGQINQVDFDGKLEKVISTQEFLNIEDIFWNKPRNKVYIKSADSAGNSKFALLDLAQKSLATLKDNTDSVAWTSLGDKIIYKYFESKTKGRTLNISDPDGSNWRKITDINYFGVSISAVPGSSDISFWPAPDAFTAISTNTISFSGENKKEILKDRFGSDLLWSPDGKTAAVSLTDQKGGKKTDLAIINADGGQFHSLNFPTFVKKCAWSADSKNLFCAMPGNIPESAILPNDWQERKITTADTFWKIEIATGKKDRLIETDKINGSYDVLNPFLSPDEKNLFFVNRADGKLHNLDL